MCMCVYTFKYFCTNFLIFFINLAEEMVSSEGKKRKLPAKGKQKC